MLAILSLSSYLGGFCTKCAEKMRTNNSRERPKVPRIGLVKVRRLGQGQRVAQAGDKRHFSLTAPGSDPQPGIEPGPYWCEANVMSTKWRKPELNWKWSFLCFNTEQWSYKCSYYLRVICRDSWVGPNLTWSLFYLPLWPPRVLEHQLPLEKKKKKKPHFAWHASKTAVTPPRNVFQWGRNIRGAKLN